MSDLIDTTEMYLRTIYELMEEGVPPMRARIAERLRQSGPTVSQTVARMERDGLLNLTDGRRIELSDRGYRLAEDVMRKHRLAERLLTDVIGLDWDLAHDEACRWEHVISETVERKLIAILGGPTDSPYGNPIPGLDRLGGPVAGGFRDGVQPVADLVADEGVIDICFVRMGENAQADAKALRAFAEAGILPGTLVQVRSHRSGMTLTGPAGAVEVAFDLAEKLFGRPASA